MHNYSSALPTSVGIVQNQLTADVAPHARPFDTTVMNPAFFTILVALSEKTPRALRSDLLDSCATFGQSADQCQLAWKGFEQSFAGKDPNTIKIGDYSPYFRVFPLPAVISRTLLWSHTGPLEAVLSNQSQGMLTSSSTLLSSSIINYMQINYNVTTWCGKQGEGIDYVNNCPPYQVGTPQYTFWAEFSRRLASGSSGVVYYLTPGYYNRTGSFFGLYELPTLLAAGSAATKLVVLNVVEEGQTECGNGDLRALYTRVRTKRPSMAFECHNVRGSADYPTEGLIQELLEIIRNTSGTNPIRWVTQKSAKHESLKTASDENTVQTATEGTS